MEADEIREYFMRLDSAKEETPFGPDVLVYKVKGKMFATLGFDDQSGLCQINLKCDPDRAVELRDQYEAIIPGYHMNKTHWNTLIIDGSLPEGLVSDLIGHSYQLVVAKLAKKDRQGLGLL